MNDVLEYPKPVFGASSYVFILRKVAVNKVGVTFISKNK